jgi:putative serine protease PepD
VTAGFGLGEVDVVKSVLPALEQGATPVHAYLGVGATDATPSGALVQTVQAGSPAATAGVKAGDVIVALGATKISGVSDLVAAIAPGKPGDRVTVAIQRDSKRRSLPLVLGKQPAQATRG